MAFAIIHMAVGTSFPKLTVSKLTEVSAQPWVSFCAVLDGALASVLTDFVFMFLQALVSKLTEFLSGCNDTTPSCQTRVTSGKSPPDSSRLKAG